LKSLQKVGIKTVFDSPLQHVYAPQVLKLQWLKNHLNTFLLKKNHKS